MVEEKKIDFIENCHIFLVFTSKSRMMKVKEGTKLSEFNTVFTSLQNSAQFY